MFGRGVKAFNTMFGRGVKACKHNNIRWQGGQVTFGRFV